MSLKRIAVILIIIGGVACYLVSISEPTAADYIEGRGIGSNFSVHEITLRDGTKCAVVMQSRGAGISCNWQYR